MTTTAFGADLAETRYADDPGGRFAYRRLGPRSTVPLVMATRFRGTIDHWDPALLEVLGSQRDVISDAGHGFLFQHAADFGHEVLNFLQ